VKQVLTNYLGRKVEIHYGGTATIKGELVDIIDGIAKLKDEENVMLFVAIDKIRVFWEVKEKDKSVGFVAQHPPRSEVGERK
jgi:hypothetical protein